VNVVGGPAYGIRTGRDENGDSIFNDRPGGVGRNTLRGATHATLNMFTQYTFVFGGQTVSVPAGVAVISGTVRTFDQSGGRYRLSIGIFAENITNRANYVGYSGTMTSPHFGRPTAVAGMRRVQLGTNFSF
jgi:hypothetical protein